MRGTSTTAREYTTATTYEHEGHQGGANPQAPPSLSSSSNRVFYAQHQQTLVAPTSAPPTETNYDVYGIQPPGGNPRSWSEHSNEQQGAGPAPLSLPGGGVSAPAMPPYHLARLQGGVGAVPPPHHHAHHPMPPPGMMMGMMGGAQPPPRMMGQQLGGGILHSPPMMPGGGFPPGALGGMMIPPYNSGAGMPDFHEYLRRLQTRIPSDGVESRSRVITFPRVSVARFILAVLRSCVIKEVMDESSGDQAEASLQRAGISVPRTAGPTSDDAAAGWLMLETRRRNRVNAISAAAGSNAFMPTNEGMPDTGIDKAAELRFLVHGIFGAKLDQLYAVNNSSNSWTRQYPRGWMGDARAMDGFDDPDFGGVGGGHTRIDAMSFVNTRLQHISESSGGPAGGPGICEAIYRPRVGEVPPYLSTELSIAVAVAMKARIRKLLALAQLVALREQQQRHETSVTRVAEPSTATNNATRSGPMVSPSPKLQVRHLLAAERLLPD